MIISNSNDYYSFNSNESVLSTEKSGIVHFKILKEICQPWFVPLQQVLFGLYY